MSSVVRHQPPPQRLIDVANPVVRALLESPLHGLLDSALLVLRLVGRRTGKAYAFPVSYVDVGGRLVVVTSHGWRANVRGVPQVEITWRGRRLRVPAELQEEPAEVARTLQAAVDSVGWPTMGRLLGLTTEEGAEVTPAELEGAVREYHLATITLDVASEDRGQR